MGGPAVWREITKTPREPFISKFEMEDKSSSAAPEHQHKVTHNRFRTDPPATPWKMEFRRDVRKNSKKKTSVQVGDQRPGPGGGGKRWCERPEGPA